MRTANQSSDSYSLIHYLIIKRITSRMKKILFIVNIDWFFISHRLPIAIAAREEGYDVHIATTITDQKNSIEKYGIKVHKIDFQRKGFNILNEIKSINQLQSCIKEVSPDIVHLVTIKPIIYGGLISKIKKIEKIVLSIAGLGSIFSDNSSSYKKIRKNIISKVYKFILETKGTEVIFQNRNDMKTLQEIYPLQDNQIHKTYGSGVDLTRYTYEKPIHSSSTKVIMISRLLKEKGVYDFVKAAEILKKTDNDIECLLVGEPDLGNPNSISHYEFSEYKRKDYITVLGFRSDIEKLLRDAHIFVLPSYYGEGLSKAIIEAAACGRPTITTNTPGCSESVIPGKTGILIPPKNPQLLANAIQELSLDIDKQEKMGENARRFAEKHFSINSVISQHLEIYKK